jgi:hypothetical protein
MPNPYSCIPVNLCCERDWLIDNSAVQMFICEHLCTDTRRPHGKFTQPEASSPQCEPPITMVFRIPREGERLKNICFLAVGQEGCGVS